MNPKVSILSAVFNESKYLPEMISSVQAQKLVDWELLFIDDGSTDNTLELISAAVEQDSRIRLVGGGRKLGKVRAFNRAYAASTGDILVLLAGDDFLPPDSLQIRVEALGQLPADEPAVAFFKIRTVSTDRRFDNIVLPRGRHGSRSGGAITVNKALAQYLFPIEECLISEDIWLSHASVDLATHVVHRPEVVLNYRLHPGNSNPRTRPFEEMNESLHQRHRAWMALLDSDRIQLTASCRKQLTRLWKAEQHRYLGRPFAVLVSPLPLVERAAMASHSSPVLFAARTRWYRLFSGRRGR